jgi:hypothetical protein
VSSVGKYCKRVLGVGDVSSVGKCQGCTLGVRDVSSVGKCQACALGVGHVSSVGKCRGYALGDRFLNQQINMSKRTLKAVRRQENPTMREEAGVGDDEPAAAVVQNFGSLTVLGFEARGATYILSHENQSEGMPKENEIFGSPRQN